MLPDIPLNRQKTRMVISRCQWLVCDPGEKLHEELLIQPGMLTTPHDKILRVQEIGLSNAQMTSALRELRNAIAVGNAHAARCVLETYVEGFGGCEIPQERRLRIGA